jgi:hypothetical protein
MEYAMKEYVPENKQQLNQLAKQALKELGKTPDPTQLYCLQLMHWALWRRPPIVSKKELPDLQEILENWMGKPPKLIMKLLTQGWNNPPGWEYTPPDLDETPIELADYLLSNMHSVLSEMDIGYPIP